MRILFAGVVSAIYGLVVGLVFGVAIGCAVMRGGRNLDAGIVSAIVITIASALIGTVFFGIAGVRGARQQRRLGPKASEESKDNAGPADAPNSKENDPG
jgi:hypothetical protein